MSTVSPFQFDLNDLSVYEALLFAFRYRLIDDCHPEGAAYRLIIGNQSVVFSQDELSAFLHGLLLRHRRTLEEAPVQSQTWLGLG